MELYKKSTQHLKGKGRVHVNDFFCNLVSKSTNSLAITSLLLHSIASFPVQIPFSLLTTPIKLIIVLPLMSSGFKCLLRVELVEI